MAWERCASVWEEWDSDWSPTGYRKGRQWRCDQLSGHSGCHYNVAGHRSWEAVISVGVN